MEKQIGVKDIYSTVTCLSCLGPLGRVRATQNCVDALHLRAGAIPFVDLHEHGIEKQFLWLNHLWPTRSIRSPSVGQLAERQIVGPAGFSRW